MKIDLENSCKIAAAFKASRVVGEKRKEERESDIYIEEVRSISSNSSKEMAKLLANNSINIPFSTSKLSSEKDLQFFAGVNNFH